MTARAIEYLTDHYLEALGLKHAGDFLPQSAPQRGNVARAAQV